MRAVSFPISVEDARAAGALVEAAPARLRIRVVAIVLVTLFLLLGARAGQLAFMHADSAVNGAKKLAPAGQIVRADIVDRNGVLLATTIPAFTLIAEPKKVWEPADVARRLAKALPELDAAAVQARLEQTDRDVVFIKRDLTPRQKQQILDLGLPGIGFRDQVRRAYPQGEMAAHILGGVNAKGLGASGLESGLDAQIRRSGEAGTAVRLSLDVRVQNALERELAAAMRAANAQGAAGIVVDARSGEVLAIASAPTFDANTPPAPDAPVHLNRAVGAVYEMGSTLKPFTIAMALDAKLTQPNESFDLASPLTVDGLTIDDYHKLGRAAPLHEALAQSSNIMAATLALRLGPERQREGLRKLGLFERSELGAPESAKPLPPRGADRVTTAVLGYGHGMAVTIASLAEAYTVFGNEGARVPLTLVARPAGEAPRAKVFTKESTRAVLAMMREAVVSGTAKRADVPGLDIAGKTGSAEKPRNGTYAPDLMLSSFAAIFPAHDPRYVIIVALDEPRRTAAFENQATGGAVAAPVVGKIAARIAPLLGLASE